jgi:hypothetical protein
LGGAYFLGATALKVKIEHSKPIPRNMLVGQQLRAIFSRQLDDFCVFGPFFLEWIMRPFLTRP